MRADTQLHNVTGSELSEIKCIERSAEDGGSFYFRNLIITMSDGSKEQINLFSDDGYKLLIDDAELASLTTELPLLKAA